MAVKKIENYNIHQNPATNENEFDVENYLNKNWNKTKEESSKMRNIVLVSLEAVRERERERELQFNKESNSKRSVTATSYVNTKKLSDSLERELYLIK